MRIFLSVTLSLLLLVATHERTRTAESFGNVDRLEQPLKQYSPRKAPANPAYLRNPIRRQPRDFEKHYDIRHWGGDPFKPFDAGRPWGRMVSSSHQSHSMAPPVRIFLRGTLTGRLTPAIIVMSVQATTRFTQEVYHPEF